VRAKNERKSTMSVGGGLTRAVGSPRKGGEESVKRSGRGSTTVQSPARRILTNKAGNNETAIGFGQAAASA
jgi:hypothetical protein